MGVSEIRGALLGSFLYGHPAVGGLYWGSLIFVKPHVVLLAGLYGVQDAASPHCSFQTSHAQNTTQQATAKARASNEVQPQTSVT